LADETTAAARPAAVREKAAGIAADLADAVSGESAQLGAHARSELKAAMIAPRASAPRKAGGPGGDPDRGVVIYGNTGRNAYEREKVEYVAGIRNVGNLSLFRRGNLWMGPRVARLDLKKDADRITVIKRYSAEYFKLIRANSVSENQVMSSQQADEELLIELRGEAYLVK